MGGMIPTIVIEVIASVSGVIVSIGVPYLIVQLKKMHRLYVTVFGVDDVSTVTGLVEIVETHDDEIDEVQDNQEDIEDTQDEVVNRVKDLEQSVEERNNKRGGTSSN